MRGGEDQKNRVPAENSEEASHKKKKKKVFWTRIESPQNPFFLFLPSEKKGAIGPRWPGEKKGEGAPSGFDSPRKKKKKKVTCDNPL